MDILAPKIVPLRKGHTHTHTTSIFSNAAQTVFITSGEAIFLKKSAEMTSA
jgi:hypothetical protein